METSRLISWLEPLQQIVKEAGHAMMPYYQEDRAFLKVQKKADHSPLTQADKLAHCIISQGLSDLAPSIPILSEEAAIPKFSRRRQWSRYWLVDPLDGTRGFIEGLAEFSVNIALIDGHTPCFGLIYSPTSHICYWALSGLGAFRESIEQKEKKKKLATRPMSHPPYRIIVGQFHSLKSLSSKLAASGDYDLLRMNSSLKFCAIAEGRADIYPRLGPTSEWDTAAGQCILEQAGGTMRGLYQNSLQYNQQASVINPPFVAIGDPSQSEKLLALFRHQTKHERRCSCHYL